MTATRTDGIPHSSPSKPHTTPTVIFGSAAAHPARKPATVRATCEAIGLPRSTFYYHSHRSSEAIALEQKIVQRLLELHEAHPHDGYRRMTRQLQLEGFTVNRKRIARLMQLHSLTARANQPDQGLFRHHLPHSSTAARESAAPTRPNQVWVADLAYARIQSGLIYTAAIVDIWSREVVGYAASTHINARLASIALHSAVRAHRPALGCVHHSTCGVQYFMRSYRDLLRQYGLIQVLDEADPTELPTIRSADRTGLSPAQQIVEVPGYPTWDEVTARAQEFIRTLYSPERIDTLVRARSARSTPITATRGSRQPIAKAVLPLHGAAVTACRK